jgi:tetratricopeptide (TPR) repeat protein
VVLIEAQLARQAGASSTSASQDAGREQLFALYTSLNDGDMLMGLAEQKSSELKAALELEMLGDFARAGEGFARALTSLDGPERDLAWRGRARGLVALQQWPLLQAAVEALPRGVADSPGLYLLACLRHEPSVPRGLAALADPELQEHWQKVRRGRRC